MTDAKIEDIQDFCAIFKLAGIIFESCSLEEAVERSDEATRHDPDKWPNDCGEGCVGYDVLPKRGPFDGLDWRWINANQDRWRRLQYFGFSEMRPRNLFDAAPGMPPFWKMFKPTPPTPDK